MFGKTLNALSPKPPPIGPVLLSGDPTNGGLNVTETDPETTGPVTRYQQPTVERWVAMLGGGWSPGNEKGRGVYMVDVWNGDLSGFTGRKDNLLWKWEYSASASGPQRPARPHPAAARPAAHRPPLLRGGRPTPRRGRWGARSCRARRRKNGSDEAARRCDQGRGPLETEVSQYPTRARRQRQFLE